MSVVKLITGSPGSGKSTVVSKVILRLKSAGIIVGGCLTSERRRNGVRVGFDIMDISTGSKGEMASAEGRLGPRVGRYRVNLQSLVMFGAEGLQSAAAKAELIVIDEVGPMELVSPEFRRSVRVCMGCGKPVLAVIHQRMEDDLLAEMRSSFGQPTEVTPINRDGLVDALARELLSALGGPRLR